MLCAQYLLNDDFSIASHKFDYLLLGELHWQGTCIDMTDGLIPGQAKAYLRGERISGLLQRMQGDDGESNTVECIPKTLHYAFRPDAYQSVCLMQYIKSYNRRKIPARRAARETVEVNDGTAASTAGPEPAVDDEAGGAAQHTPWFASAQSLPPELKAPITNMAHPQAGTHEIYRRKQDVVPKISGPRLRNRLEVGLVAGVFRVEDILQLAGERPAVETDEHARLEAYCESVLIMLRPWRTLDDLRADDDQLWYDAALAHAFTPWNAAVIANMQNYHDSKATAAASRAAQAEADVRQRLIDTEHRRRNGQEDDEEDDEEAASQFRDEIAALQRELQLMSAQIGPKAPGKYCETMSQELLEQYNLPNLTERALQLPRGMVLPAACPGPLPATGSCQPQQAYDIAVPPETLTSWDAHTTECAQRALVPAPEDQSTTALAFSRLSQDDQVTWLTTCYAQSMAYADRDAEIAAAVHPDPNAPPTIQAFSQARNLNEQQHKVFVLISREVLGSHHLWPRLHAQRRGMPANARGLITQGTAGTGKSHVIKAVLAYANAWGLAGSVATVAPTGIAATVVGGTTIHACFGIDHASKDAQADKHGEVTDELARALSGVKVFIADELSMISCLLFLIMHRKCQAVARFAGEASANLPFGGKAMCLFGESDGYVIMMA